MATTARTVIRKAVDDLVNSHAEAPWAQQRKAASKSAKDRIDDAIVFRVFGIAGPYVHTRKAPSLDAAAAVVLGDSDYLRSLAPGLTTRERNEWARQTEYVQPNEWLWNKLELPEKIKAPATEVVRWVAKMYARPDTAAAMERSFCVFGDHVEGAPINRLDELLPVDLQDGVVSTFSVSAHRRIEEKWDGPEELAPKEEWHDHLPSGVTVIRHWSRLWHEGTVMRHCVADYASRVHSRECTVLSVIAPDGTRSTIEWRDGKICQHQGPLNDPPSPSCNEIAAKIRVP